MILKSLNFLRIISIFSCLINFIQFSNEHGRLVDPPGRSTAWRYGFKTPVNYNDNELFCGGYQTQHRINKGKCGICGDPYNGERKNELPNGLYAKSLSITRSYNESSTINAKVQLTANHKGYFVFKICPATTLKKEVSQDCLDGNVLQVLNSQEKYKYIVPNEKCQIFSVLLKLPSGLACERCVMQWTYTAGNNWGKCADGKWAVGCGPQETFRACADIKIYNKKALFNLTTLSSENEITFETTTSNYDFLTTKKLSTTNKKYLSKPSYSTKSWIKPFTLSVINSVSKKLYFNNNRINILSKKCAGTGLYRRLPGIEKWCKINCPAAFCPVSHCKCIPK